MCSGIRPLQSVPRSSTHKSAKTKDAFEPIQTICFRESLIWFLVWCKNILHETASSDKIIRRLQVQPDLQAANFLYYRSSQLKVVKSLSINHLTRRFCKNRRVCCRETPRRPLGFLEIKPSFLRNMQGTGLAWARKKAHGNCHAPTVAIPY